MKKAFRIGLLFSNIGGTINAHVAQVSRTGLQGDLRRFGGEVRHIRDFGVRQRPRDKDRVMRARTDSGNAEAGSVTERGHSTPGGVGVSNLDGGPATEARGRRVQQIFEFNVVHPHSGTVEKAHDVVPAGAVTDDVADADGEDVVFAHVFTIAAHFGEAVLPRRVVAVGYQRRQRNKIVTSRALYGVDVDVVTAAAEIQPILIEQGHDFPVDRSAAGRNEIQIGDPPVRAIFKRHRPRMGVADRQIFESEVFDVHEQDADIAPVSGLGFSHLARVAAAALIRLRAESLGAVAGGAGIVRAFEGRPADAEDADVPHDRDIGDTVPAVGGADEVVAAVVRELDPAAVEDERGVGGDSYRRVEQPVVALACRIGAAGGDADRAARSARHADRRLDALKVVAGEVVGVAQRHFFHRPLQPAGDQDSNLRSLSMVIGFSRNPVKPNCSQVPCASASAVTA